MFSEVLTVTVSPGVHGVDGMKLPPSPSESAAIVPPCTPLLEPITLIVPSRDAGTPRNVSWVAGDAKCPFGIGNTYTGGGPLGALGAGAGFFLVFATATAAPDKHRTTRKATATIFMGLAALGILGTLYPVLTGVAHPRLAPRAPTLCLLCLVSAGQPVVGTLRREHLGRAQHLPLGAECLNFVCL